MATKSFVALPPGVAVDYILNVEVPSMQAKRKMKFGSDRTVREAIQLILRNYPIENLDYLALYLKTTGIWLEETRRLYTYLLSNEDTLELKYKKGTGVSTETVTVYHENSQSPEFVKIYPETTVKGLIQSLENKKHFHIDKLSIIFNGKTLNLDETLTSNNICDGTTVEFKDKDIIESTAAAPPKRPPVPGRGPMMGMNPLAANPNMLSELREKRLQKTASIAHSKPEPDSTPESNNELKNLLDKRKSASTTINKPVFPSPPPGANPTGPPSRPPRGPPPANAETKAAEPKAPEPKPQMPRPPPNRVAPTAPTRQTVVQAPPTNATTTAPSAPPPRPPPITGRPPISKEPVAAPVVREPVVAKEPVKEPVKEIEPPSLSKIKEMSDSDIFNFDDFVDFDKAVQEAKAPASAKPKETTPAPTQPINIPAMPAKAIAAVDDFASALDELDSFDFEVAPTPKTASSSSPPKTFTPPKSTLGTSPAATKPLQATPRPVSNFATPVTVVESPPRAAPVHNPPPRKMTPPMNPPPRKMTPPMVNNPPPVTAPPPTPNNANSSPPPRSAPPPRPATPTQANNINYRKSVRFDAYKQQQQPVQERGNSVKEAWIDKLMNFEQEYNGTIMFTTNDDATIKDASRKMVNLCNPNKEGNKEVESYLRELDRSELINLVGCLTAALSYHQ